MKNIKKLIATYFKNVKNFIFSFFTLISYIKKVILDEIFFDSNIREPFRELIKGFRFYFSSKIQHFFFNDFFRKSNTILSILMDYIIKYVLVFFFILWILFELLFLRFYLVDTPLDTKMYQDRKEYAGGLRRFIPVVVFEAVSFYSRPFWRVFNNFLIVLANLEAVLWLIYYVYIIDLVSLLRYFYTYFIKLVFYVFNVVW